MFPDKEVEKILIKGIQKGEEGAFEALFKLFYSKLCNYAVILVKDSNIAEEIVQETFIRIWEMHREINIERSLNSYLYRSVYNNCINFIKKSRSFRKLNEKARNAILYHHQLAVLNLNPDLPDQLLSEEYKNKFEQALKELPEQCRLIFLMSREEGLSYLEIAGKLNISVNTVKTQMKRALKKLREILRA